MDNQHSENDGFLTDGEVQRLIMSLLQSRGERGAGEQDMKAVIDWADGIRLQNTMLDLVLDGRVEVVDVEDSEPVFATTESV